MPGLDGLRAVAVLAVIGYHLNLSWVKGGLLGVGVFFTLSGYLITDLLLGHWNDRGSLGLTNFWLRRARRLLPALSLMLIVVAVAVALFDAAQLPAFREQVSAAAAYFSNWWTIAQHGSYFSRFAAPLPLAEIASTCGVSERTLTRKFTEATGVTPLRYQQLLRLERAEHLISHGATVESAARTVGFADPRMLRRLRSRSPSAPTTAVLP